MFSYSPAPDAGPESWALVSDRFVLVVELEAARVLRLWQTMCETDATLEALLELLAAGGVRTIPDFALVELVDAPTGSIAIALRGRGRAELGGTTGRHLSGKGAGTWLEASAQSIAEMTVGLRGEEPGPVRLPIGRGVVRTEQVHWGVPLPRVEPAEQDVLVPDWAADLVPSAPAAGMIASAGSPDAAEELDDNTILGRRHGGAPLGDADEATVLGTRRATAPGYVLRFAPGQELTVAATTVVGRAPRASAGTAIHALPSPRKEVSSRHAELRPTPEGLLVCDLGSTNGTRVFPAGAQAVELRGEEFTLHPGDRIDFGDGNVAEVSVTG